ncbi:hypothetical protein FQZ97_952150 [compost metagenome]
MQALVEQHVGVVGQGFPGSEGAGLLLVGRGLFGVVQVLAALALAGFAVGAEQVFDVAKQVGLGTEMAEVVVARLLRLGRLDLHFLAVVAVEAVAFDDAGRHVLAAEDVLEGAGDGGGAGTGRTGDGDDGMAF